MGNFRTIADVVEQSGFSRQFVHAEIKRGHLQSCKVGRRRVISHGAFVAWMRGKPNSGGSEPFEAHSNDAPGDAEILAVMERLETRMDEIGKDIATIKAALVAREVALRESLR